MPECALRSVMSHSLRPWAATQQAFLSTGFFRQEYWSGLPCPPPGDPPHTGIEPVSSVSSASQEDSLLLSHRGREPK